MTMAMLNAAIARLSFMVNGNIGVDWRTGMPFILHTKGNYFDAVCEAVAVLQDARATISRLTADNEALRKDVALASERWENFQKLASDHKDELVAEIKAASARADALAQEVERLRLPEGTPMLVAGTEIIISFASVDDAQRAFDALEYAMSREPAALGDRP